MSPFTLPYFGTINSLRGGIHQKIFGVGSSPLELPVIIKSVDWISE